MLLETILADPENLRQNLNYGYARISTDAQDLAADLAAYRQARAMVSEQRAALWPTLWQPEP